ncbi:MAG: ATP-binding cassette domain-containing protein, partial [Candidatus Poribacteria bacterium]
VSLLQARNHTFPGLTVREALRLSHVTDVPENIRHLLGKRMSELSGGEKQKVAMACATNGRAFTVGLLDEPFSALDAVAVEDLLYLLPNFLKNAGLLVVIPSRLENFQQKTTKGE